ncbi:YraN family protein [bacterium]|nr:YraN family protein [bacterium]
MATNSYETGRATEDWAVQYLVELGYEILARNFRSKTGEIDVVARQGKTIVFLEVKGSLRQPRVEAVQPRQIQRVRRAAQDFLMRRNLSQESLMRFDVLLVWGPPYQVSHLLDAF